MKATLSPFVVSLLIGSIALSGCSSGQLAAKRFDSPAGEYKGAGKFDAGAGSMKVEGRLVLDADGRYALTISPLGALGAETGTYQLQGASLTLQPSAPESQTGADGRPTLASALATSRKAKTMNMDPEFSTIRWSDGPMTLEFTRR